MNLWAYRSHRSISQPAGVARKNASYSLENMVVTFIRPIKFMTESKQCVPLLNCRCTRVKTEAVADRRNRPSVSSPVNQHHRTSLILASQLSRPT